MYGEHFWRYAEKSPFYKQILKNKASFGDQDRKKKDRAAKEIIEHAKAIVASDYTFAKKICRS